MTHLVYFIADTDRRSVSFLHFMSKGTPIMPRTVKAPAVRRTEILDAAQYLITTKGYEQMTIQDILDRLQISKGAFYHYFDSKQALLEAIIERMQHEVAQILLPIVHD